MNWYKKIKLIKICQIIEIPHYTDIGHWGEGEKTHRKPNYMWLLVGKNIKVVKETDKTPEHMSAFPGIPIDKLYGGRYESDTGKLTMTIPRIGPLAHRNVPNFLFDLLYKKFPNITQIYQY